MPSSPLGRTGRSKSAGPLLLSALLGVAFFSGCATRAGSPHSRGRTTPAFSLKVMALLYGPHADFEENALTGFAAQKGYRIRYIPAFESDFDRLHVYQQLF